MGALVVLIASVGLLGCSVGADQPRESKAEKAEKARAKAKRARVAKRRREDARLRRMLADLARSERRNGGGSYVGNRGRKSAGSYVGGSDLTPTKLDGTESHEFEPDDIERADDASDAVKDYCSGAVSEAQRVGCESHVTESDIP